MRLLVIHILLVCMQAAPHWWTLTSYWKGQGSIQSLYRGQLLPLYEAHHCKSSISSLPKPSWRPAKKGQERKPLQLRSYWRSEKQWKVSPNLTHMALSFYLSICIPPSPAVREISQLLNTGLDDETLRVCVQLLEAGVNPEALATVVQELRRETGRVQVRERGEVVLCLNLKDCLIL